jgi:hypothetical protein
VDGVGFGVAGFGVVVAGIGAVDMGAIIQAWLYVRMVSMARMIRGMARRIKLNV